MRGIRHMKADEAAGTGQAPVFAAMPEPGKKVPIGNGAYLIYGFDKKPKMGTVIMKVEVYTPDGKQDTSLEVLARLRHAFHEGRPRNRRPALQAFQKRGISLPINIVMPGDWEIRLTIKKDGKVIFRGSYKFDV